MPIRIEVPRTQLQSAVKVLVRTYLRVDDLIQARFELIGYSRLRLRLRLLMIEGPRVARLATGTGWRRIGERRERGCFRSRVGHEGRGWMVERWWCVEGKKGTTKVEGEGMMLVKPHRGELLLSMTLGAVGRRSKVHRECWSLSYE